MAVTPIRIALTPGAENGVGPELLVRAVLLFNKGEPVEFYWCGDAESIKLACMRANTQVKIRQQNAVLENGLALKISSDVDARSILKRQAHFLDISVDLAKAGIVHAIVTGPIEKAALAYAAKGPFFGQTEYFATHLPAINKPFMAFLGGPFMLSLLTTHIPLRCVADAITEEIVFDHIQTVAKYCAKILNRSLTDVKIAVLGLNPHAGENGLLGDEEQKIFLPAILRAKSLGLTIEGPLSADGFFAYVEQRDEITDVVIAPFHDQGLSPYKLLSKQGAVNVTFGLSHIRVSPAHGTANDLVGSMKASPLSTQNAIKIAMDLVKAGL